MSKTNSKVMTAEAAISAYVKDGDCLAFGGFSTNRRAYGLVREIIRQGKKNFTIESGPAGGDIDMLVGAGAVQAISIGYIANAGFSMVLRRFRAAAEAGMLLVEDYSLDAQTIAYHGAALGLSYMPVKNMLGSDLEEKWGISEEARRKNGKLPVKKFLVQEDPFHPGERLCLIPTPKIDVALIHVQQASPEGICRISGAEFQDVDIAMAAAHTIVSCEELVSNEQMRKDPHANTLPGICVSAVVPMPYGAHPSQCDGRYDYDPQALIEYDQMSRTQESFAQYLERYILPNHEAYLNLIGKERLEKLKVDPKYGYKCGLPRR